MTGTRLFPVVLSAIVLCGCGVAPTGPAHVPPTGNDTAVVRPVWGDANVRVREINGRGVSMLFPEDVIVSSGVTRMGLLAWAGPGPSQVGICVVFEALPKTRYEVRVASFRADWAVSLVSTNPSVQKVVPLLVRHQPFDTAVLPCEGVRL